MNSNYLERIIKISTNDNKRAQQILHKIGDNEWCKTLFIGSLLINILLPIESILLLNYSFILPLFPLLFLYFISNNTIKFIVNYLNYRKYLLDNNVINIWGKCKKDN